MVPVPPSWDAAVPGWPAGPPPRCRPSAPARRRGPENGTPHRRPAPTRGPLGRLLDPRGHEAPGLSDEQVEQIGDLARRVRRHMQEAWEGVRNRLHRAGPEGRQHILREMKEKMANRWADHRRRVMKRLEEILEPDQRERLKEWMHEGGPGKRSGRHQPAPPERPPDRRHRDREGSHHPAEERQTPRCRPL